MYSLLRSTEFWGQRFFKMTGVRSGLVESSSRRLWLKQFLPENVFFLPPSLSATCAAVFPLKRRRRSKKSFTIACADAICSRKCSPPSCGGILVKNLAFAGCLCRSCCFFFLKWAGGGGASWDVTFSVASLRFPLRYFTVGLQPGQM